ncbi:hypothetical protein K466DRAFT_654958 [Polyporus arcularius HHB13444]|uniref:Uncharacterized protein n=1 Tax=Polyporus arcularius HHB13444 TaxID=1314778 RepID=A0A5C3P5Y6_9APHY|nr:hypothetical protein K466DRAFT_654958 [Polyporus arcularius HHB13444]
MITVIPMIWSVIHSQLPPAKLQKLEQALVDTEILLQSIIEEGLQFREIPHYESYLINFRSGTERIREETYRATTFWQQVGAWIDGLSSRIALLCDEVLDVRINICERSAEARAQLSGEEVAMPARRGLIACLGRSLGRVFAFVCGKKATIDGPAAAAGNVTSHPILAAPACEQAVPPDGEPATASVTHVQSNEEVGARHACAAPNAGRVPAKKRMRRMLQAIGRLEREMSAHRVRNAALRKVIQAARRQRSNLNIAQSHTRRSCKSRDLLIPCGTAAQVVVLSQACDSEGESDVDSWEDELVVSSKTHVIV